MSRPAFCFVPSAVGPRATSLSLAALATLALAPIGCSRLTAPPEPEPTFTSAPAASAAPQAAAAPTAAAAAAPPAPAAAPAPDAPLGVVDVVVGKGQQAKAGDKVKVHYTGTLTNGTEFDSSLPRKQPFAFTLGQHQVIAGWDQGVAGMKVGGKRKLTIPPGLGYGAKGAGGGKIPPNATLLFDVELIEIEK